VSDLSPKKCSPKDISLKAFFLGPQSENYDLLHAQILRVMGSWTAWRRAHHSSDGGGISEEDRNSACFGEAWARVESHLGSLLERYRAEVPMYSPRFVSHMVSETSIPSLLGHFMAMLHNPNNVTRDSSSVGLKVESESINLLARMLNFGEPARVSGHFTSGGTVANFEALSRALKRQCLWLLDAIRSGADISLQEAAHAGWAPDQSQDLLEMPSLMRLSSEIRLRWGVEWRPRVFVPISAHYSWAKAVSLFGLGEEALVYVPLDRTGRLDVEALRSRMNDELEKGASIVAVVSVAGSTEMGTIDPIERVQACLDAFLAEKGLSIWHHIDAAYGGFFACCPQAELTTPWYASLKEGFRGANSVTVDPHKLGYIPYAAGAVLVRDPRDYHLFNPGAPYLVADAEWPGAQTLEGSRAATGPTAFWLSAQSLGLDEDGYGRLLLRTLKQRQTFQDLVAKDRRFLVLPGCHSNLALVSLSPHVGRAMKLSDFEECVSDLMESSQQGVFGYHLSMTTFSLRDHEWLKSFLREKEIELDRGELKALRFVFMNPFLDTRESRVRHIEKLVLELGTALEAMLLPKG